ncbi:hypothetical protein C440_09928 [Haloferax mucosum ATCC BAA-1512]|uniref:Uncharacterized protein n=1 Tax=Haloferax mucosum ATCC BAA-1512 TaxID=662479 RepID=M0IF81_9EURY|nr:hypothetical protein [Haloferax mucosum]ELZ94488.1 hypothetical protein C440_09928 [Haloferax mucosum ATCC BAA-1512]
MLSLYWNLCGPKRETLTSADGSRRPLTRARTPRETFRGRGRRRGALRARRGPTPTTPWLAVGDRVEVVHVHDNDGSGDDHEPLTDFQPIVEATAASYYVFEIKTVEDVAVCVER